MSDKPMTARQAIAELVKLAGVIALEAPEKQHRYSPRCYVDWRHVHRIRELLPIAGVDYAAARVLYKQKLQEAAAAAKETT